MTIIEIHNKNSKDNFLEVNLTNILDCLDFKNLNLRWYILNIEAVTKTDSSINQSDFENIINNSNFLYEITWKELINFDVMFNQFINLLIVGTAEAYYTIEKPKDMGKYSDYEIVLQLFDSSYWIVSSKMPTFIRNVKTKFSSVKNVRDLTDIISA